MRNLERLPLLTAVTILVCIGDARAVTYTNGWNEEIYNQAAAGCTRGALHKQLAISAAAAKRPLTPEEQGRITDYTLELCACLADRSMAATNPSGLQALAHDPNFVKPAITSCAKQVLPKYSH